MDAGRSSAKRRRDEGSSNGDQARSLSVQDNNRLEIIPARRRVASRSPLSLSKGSLLQGISSDLSAPPTEGPRPPPIIPLDGPLQSHRASPDDTARQVVDLTASEPPARRQTRARSVSRDYCAADDHVVSEGLQGGLAASAAPASVAASGQCRRRMRRCASRGIRRSSPIDLTLDGDDEDADNDNDNVREREGGGGKCHGESSDTLERRPVIRKGLKRKPGRRRR